MADVDRIAVNEALTQLAARFGVVLDDAVLNELTHQVADALDKPGSANVRSRRWAKLMDYAFMSPEEAAGTCPPGQVLSTLEDSLMMAVDPHVAQHEHDHAVRDLTALRQSALCGEGVALLIDRTLAEAAGYAPPGEHGAAIGTDPTCDEAKRR